MLRAIALAVFLFVATAGTCAPATGQTIPPQPSSPDRPLRICFIGNSLTRSIGWRDADKFDRPWGMAATQPDKDFVHRVQLQIAAATGQIPEIAVASLDLIYPEHFANARQVCGALAPDLIVLEAGDAAQGMTEAEYKATLKEIAAWFAPPAKLLITGVWYVDRLEQYNRDVAAELGAPFVPLHDLNTPANWQRADCGTAGAVCNHPGDVGFAAIADRMTPVILSMDIPRRAATTSAAFLPWTPNE